MTCGKPPARSGVTGAFSAETTCASGSRSTSRSISEGTEVTTSFAINARGHSSHAGEEAMSSTAMSSTSNKKSGLGLSDGVVSELATFWEVLPGHEDELRAATERFAARSRGRPGQEPPHRPAGPAPRDLRQRDPADVGHDVRERLGPLLRRLRPDRHPPLPRLDAAHRPVHARHGVAGGVRRGGEVPPGQPRHRGADEAQRRRPQGDRPVGAEPGDRLLQQPARARRCRRSSRASA